MLYLLNRFGSCWARIVMTVIIVAGSLLIVILLDLALIGSISKADVLIGTITPAVLAYFSVGKFISLLERLQATENELKQLANEDYLTGLYNRRRFLELAEIEWNRAQRLRYPLALLMVDVDHFKLLNDRYGHAAGDDGLQHLAHILRQEVRQYDIVGRYGGEEFAILLPGTGAAAGQKIAERILERLSASTFGPNNTQIRMTVSIGLAEKTDDCTGLEHLLMVADQAMYRAKANGRNQVCAKP